MGGSRLPGFLSNEAEKQHVILNDVVCDYYGGEACWAELVIPRKTLRKENVNLALPLMYDP